MKFLLINENWEFCLTDDPNDRIEFGNGMACSCIDLETLKFLDGEPIPLYAGFDERNRAYQNQINKIFKDIEAKYGTNDSMGRD